MQAHRPWRPCSPPTVATRVQTERARPTTFTRPTPTGAPGSPLPTHSPTPFCEPHPTVRPFPAGRGYRSAPHAPSSPLPPRKAANGAQPFSPFSAPILYIRAREGGFSSPRREGIGAPGGGKRKGGEKRTGRWTFSPHRGKDCGKQIVDKWKIGAYFPPPRDERMRSGERCPNSGALNRESAARSTPRCHTRWRKQALKREKRSLCPRKSPHSGTETQHPSAKTRLLRTEKGAASRKRPREKPKTVAPLAR